MFSAPSGHSDIRLFFIGPYCVYLIIKMTRQCSKEKILTISKNAIIPTGITADLMTKRYDFSFI